MRPRIFSGLVENATFDVVTRCVALDSADEHGSYPAAAAAENLGQWMNAVMSMKGERRHDGCRGRRGDDPRHGAKPAQLAIRKRNLGHPQTPWHPPACAVFKPRPGRAPTVRDRAEVQSIASPAVSRERAALLCHTEG